MSLTYRKSINRYSDLPSHEITRMGKDGERDGKEELPNTSDTEPSGIILKTLTDARTSWDRYLSEKKSYLEDQNKKLSNLEYDIDTNIQAEISKESAKLDDEQNLYISQEGNKSSKYIKLEEDLQTTKIDYDKLRSELNRPLLTKFEKYYLPFLFILSLAEIPVNRKAFALFFPGEGWVLLLLAIAVGVILVYFSHTVGHLIRETNGEDTPQNLKFKKYIGISSISIIMFSLVWILGLMRQQLANVEQAGSTIEDLVEKGGLNNVQDTFFTSMGQDGFLLMVFNITIIAAGIVASFFRHDPHPYYEKVVTSYNKLRDKSFQMKQKVEDELNNIQEKYNKKIEALRNREQNLNKDKDSLLKEIKSINEFDKEDFKNVINSVDRLLISYQSGNKKTRKTKEPSFFKKANSNLIKEFLTK